jgi:hypothetical protein
MSGVIHLEKSFFSEKERVLCTLGELRCSLFRYSTGVPAVRLENSKGYLILLPFNGQQIWDAVFDGRSLKMYTKFEEPEDTRTLVDTYGMFMTHCGALRMGCPAPEDDHPLHGELTTAPYQEASILFGEDDQGRFLALSGVYHYRKGFGDFYDAIPVVKLYERSSLFDISMEIRNRSEYPMDLMYMCHLNFLAGDDSRILQTAPWEADSMVLRTSIPAHVKPTPEFLDFLARLKQAPEETAVIRSSDVYDPEIVFFIGGVRADTEGRAHFMQRHPGGVSDYVSYDTAEFSHHVRWILKNKNQKVLGILPSTCEPEGYAAEKKKGNVRSLAGNASVVFRIRAGALDRAQGDVYEKEMQNS